MVLEHSIDCRGDCYWINPGYSCDAPSKGVIFSGQESGTLTGVCVGISSYLLNIVSTCCSRRQGQKNWITFCWNILKWKSRSPLNQWKIELPNSNTDVWMVADALDIDAIMRHRPVIGKVKLKPNVKWVKMMSRSNLRYAIKVLLTIHLRCQHQVCSLNAYCFVDFCLSHRF